MHPPVFSDSMTQGVLKLPETMPVSDSILEFCSTPRTRAEIVAFVGKSKKYVMSLVKK
jgi:hypothetical protein